MVSQSQILTPECLDRALTGQRNYEEDGQVDLLPSQQKKMQVGREVDAYVDQGVEGDEGNHGLALHPDDTLALLHFGKTAGGRGQNGRYTIGLGMARGGWSSYKRKFSIATTM